jgi:quinoprotein glucose dehydrogenase
MAMGKGAGRAATVHESTASLLRSLSAQAPRVVPAVSVASALAPSAIAAETDSKIWNGVYNTAQAERGRSNFEKNCSNCHNSNLSGSVRGPALRGNSFLKDWGNTTANELFVKLRDSMPATYPDSVPEAEKLDILAYLLQANGFPAGNTELSLNQKELENIRIVQKGEQAASNFASVHMAGCLTLGSGKDWTLTSTTDGTVGLLGASRFHPESHRGQQVEASGLLYRDSGTNLLNLTSLETTGTDCRN